jgi:hypothetical protein
MKLQEEDETAVAFISNWCGEEGKRLGTTAGRSHLLYDAQVFALPDLVIHCQHM